MSDITFPASTLRYCELQCNSVRTDYTNCPEVKLIEKFLLQIPEPRNCLDIGAGIGRVSVYLYKHFGWKKTKYWLLDGNSGDTQIAGMNYTSNNKFYNSMQATKSFCTANGLANFELINLDNNDTVPVNTFDLCYSCKAIGFHWPIKEYLEMLERAAKIGSYLFFELRSIEKECYNNEQRLDRARRFTYWQIDHINRNNHYKVIKTESNQNIFMVIAERVK